MSRKGVGVSVARLFSTPNALAYRTPKEKLTGY
jgi:hypothetical protein